MLAISALDVAGDTVRVTLEGRSGILAVPLISDASTGNFSIPGPDGAPVRIDLYRPAADGPLTLRDIAGRRRFIPASP